MHFQMVCLIITDLVKNGPVADVRLSVHVVAPLLKSRHFPSIFLGGKGAKFSENSHQLNDSTNCALIVFLKGVLLMAENDEKEQLIFTQWCEDFRALQSVFWRIPFFAMTITGGLGAAILAFDGAPDIKRYLLVFIALCNVSFMFMGWRVRKTMETLLVKILQFEGIDKPVSGFLVLKLFTALYVLVVLSCTGVAFFAPNNWLEKPPASPISIVTHEHTDEG